jgi:YHS domain-containing protein
MEQNGKVFAHSCSRNSYRARRNVMTMDPVCGARMDERTADIETMFAGKKYFFCSEECRTEFEDHPDEYLEIAA